MITGRKGGRPARGALLVVACMLVGSAFLRLGSGPAQAIAREITEPEAETAEAEACEVAPDIAAVLLALEEREAALAEKEAAAAERDALLGQAEGAIRENLAALEAAEAELAKQIATAQTAAEDDIGRLTLVYETMKPKEAALLFEQMEPSFAAGFLARMKPESAAALMAGLSPETAYALSVELAGRNAKAPRE